MYTVFPSQLEINEQNCSHIFTRSALLPRYPTIRQQRKKYIRKKIMSMKITTRNKKLQTHKANFERIILRCIGNGGLWWFPKIQRKLNAWMQNLKIEFPQVLTQLSRGPNITEEIFVVDGNTIQYTKCNNTINVILQLV